MLINVKWFFQTTLIYHEFINGLMKMFLGFQMRGDKPELQNNAINRWHGGCCYFKEFFG